MLTAIIIYLAFKQNGAQYATPEKPNILVVMSDQQHYGAFGKISGFFSTPNMDHLADEGIMFSNAFVTSPQCSPSRSSFYTGLYPHKTGIIGNVGSLGNSGGMASRLGDQFKTIGGYLRPEGYFTGYVGKWHLGKLGSHVQDYDIGRFAAVDRGDHTTDQQKTGFAMEFLETWKKDSRQPFALFLNYINPHHVYDFVVKDEWKDSGPPESVPLPDSYYKEDLSGKPVAQREYINSPGLKIFRDKPEGFWKKYREYYKKKVALFDQELGVILKKIREMGIWEETIVIVTSDHGDLDAQHQLAYKGPFAYDALMKVPLIIHIPKKYGGTDSGIIDDLTVNVDLLPTILDFANVSLPIVDGKSLKPRITGKKKEYLRRYVVGQYYGMRNWPHPLRMIRTNSYKYVDHLSGMDEFYVLSKDPNEIYNRISDPHYIDVRKDLVHSLNLWIDQQEDPFRNLVPSEISE